MSNFQKACRKIIIGTGYRIHIWLSFNKNFWNDNNELGTHAEPLNNTFPLVKQGRSNNLKAIKRLYSMCPTLRGSVISTANAGNLALDGGSGGIK